LTTPTADAPVYEPTPTAIQTWALADIVADEAQARRLGAGWLRSAVAWLQDHRLELLMRPSARPGVEGGLRYPGAGVKQMEFWAAARVGARRLAIRGANRSAKTSSVGGAFALFLRDEAQDGDILWIIAQDWDMMRAVPQRFLWQFLPRSMFPAGLEYQDKLGFGASDTLVLTLPGGRGSVVVRFKNEQMELNKYESEPVRGIWWTEASRESVYAACITRLVDRRGFLWIDYLPKYGWLKKRVRQNREFRCWQFGMQDNAHNLPDGSVAATIAEYQGQASEIQVRVYGEEASAFGSVYPQFSTTKHVCRRFALPTSVGREAKPLPRFRCYDYGFSTPSACLWAVLLPSGFKFPAGVGSVWDGRELDRQVLLVYREYYVTQRTIPVQAADIIAASGNQRVPTGAVGLGGQLKYRESQVGEQYRFTVCDPSIFNEDQSAFERGESKASIFRRNGIELKKGKRASGPDGHTLVATVRIWFENDKIVFFDDCENAIYEHESWRYRSNSDGVVAGNEPFEDHDNHTADSLKALLAEDLSADSIMTSRYLGGR
jgi:phage terminase large subunit-like protein